MDVRPWIVAGVAVVTFVAFVPSLLNQFVDWDDPENFITNPSYRGLGWTQLKWMWTTFHLGHWVPASWMTLGLEYLAIGGALLLASRSAERATALIWAVLGIEVVRGMGTDAYMLARGYAVAPHVVWLFVHAIVITTGLYVAVTQRSSGRSLCSPG